MAPILSPRLAELRGVRVVPPDGSAPSLGLVPEGLVDDPKVGATTTHSEAGRSCRRRRRVPGRRVQWERFQINRPR